MHDAHLSSSNDSPLSPGPDPRIGALGDFLSDIASRRQGSSPGGPVGDSRRSRQAPELKQPVLGVVIQVIPHLHWYRVQTKEYGWVSATALIQGPIGPLGVRDTSPAYPPNTQVLITMLPSGEGVILGAVPANLIDGQGPGVDQIMQAGCASGRRMAMHRYPGSASFKFGGILDYSSGRPDDATTLSQGQMAETGVGYFASPFFTFIRATERCGLWCILPSEATVIRGQQLQIESPAQGWATKDDEGEVYEVHGHAVYPWETLGLYVQGTEFTQDNDDKDVQYHSSVAGVDLLGSTLDIQSVFRRVEFGGYLGQGGLRTVMCPTTAGGIRHEGDEQDDRGVFQESIGLGGDYSLTATRSLRIGRRPRLVQPRQRLRPEDGRGDDRAADNYRFSGLDEGDGTPHKLQDIQVEGENQAARRAAGVLDQIAYDLNWGALHPFHYHEKDWSTPEEQALQDGFDRSQVMLNFDVEDRAFLDDPEPIPQRVDHRLETANYFQNESDLNFLPDGGIVLRDGSAASLTTTGGRAQVDAPLDIVINAGRRVIIMGGEIIIRSEGSVDISSAQQDVRLKAERNLQILAGNSGQGGLLLESKGEGQTHDYDQKVGEDVTGAGVVIRSAGQAALIGQQVYVRSESPSTSDGIVLDAGQGKSALRFAAQTIDAFLTSDFNLWFGPSADSSEVQKLIRLSRSDIVFDTTLKVGGQIISYGDSASLTVDGSIRASGSIETSGNVASRNGGQLGKVPDDFQAEVSEVAQGEQNSVDDDKTQGQQTYERIFTNGLYGDHGLGNDQVLSAIGFSFRDDDEQKQYGSAECRWQEALWTQLVRLGGASGGRAWEETTVSYQGKNLMPWPGRRAWEEDTSVFLAIESLTMYDPAAGGCRDRGAAYEEPKLSDWKPMTMADGLRLTKQG